MTSLGPVPKLSFVTLSLGTFINFLNKSIGSSQEKKDLIRLFSFPDSTISSMFYLRTAYQQSFYHICVAVLRPHDGPKLRKGTSTHSWIVVRSSEPREWKIIVIALRLWLNCFKSFSYLQPSNFNWSIDHSNSNSIAAVQNNWYNTYNYKKYQYIAVLSLMQSFHSAFFSSRIMNTFQVMNPDGVIPHRPAPSAPTMPVQSSVGGWSWRIVQFVSINLGILYMRNLARNNRVKITVATSSW